MNRHNSILAIGAHPDDVELGCGGSLSRWAAEGAQIHLLIASRGEDGGAPTEREREARAAAEQLGASIRVLDFASASLPLEVRPLLACIEEALRASEASLVVSHSSHDRHQDHRVVASTTLSAIRNTTASLLAYSHTICAEGFRPTYYVDIANHFDEKVKLVGHHSTQNSRVYTQPDALRTDARYRGLQLRREGFYEAFEVIRMVV